MMEKAPTLNECQQSVIYHMELHGLIMTPARKILIDLLGEFKTGFTANQLYEKADKHGICEATVFNFIKVLRNAKAVKPPPPAYYSFNVVDPEIVKG